MQGTKSRVNFGILLWAIGFPLWAWGQAVQLPTYSHFGTSTTVLAPDRGSAQMGGVTSSARGSTTRGTPILPFQNRGYGASTSTANTSASVYVHDLEGMDREILGSPSPSAPVSRSRGKGLTPADFLSVGSSVSRQESDLVGHAMVSMDESTLRYTKRPELNADLDLSVERPKGAARTVSGTEGTRESEKRSKMLLKKGISEEKAGRNASAMLYYEEALRIAPGDLRKKVQNRMEQLRKE